MKDRQQKTLKEKGAIPHDEFVKEWMRQLELYFKKKINYYEY